MSRCKCTDLTCHPDDRTSSSPATKLRAINSPSVVARYHSVVTEAARFVLADVALSAPRLARFFVAPSTYSHNSGIMIYIYEVSSTGSSRNYWLMAKQALSSPVGDFLLSTVVR